MECTIIDKFIDWLIDWLIDLLIRKELESIRQEILVAKQRLEELDRDAEKLETTITKYEQWSFFLLFFRSTLF